VLCGARITEHYSYAFVAEIDGGFNSMHYMEYTEADIFYSICVPQNPSLDYAGQPIPIFLPHNLAAGSTFYA